jgi:hypothetical protein
MIYEVVAAIAAGAALASGPIDEDYTQAQPVDQLPPTFSSGQLRYYPNAGFSPPPVNLIIGDSELTIPPDTAPRTGYTMGNLAKPATMISGTFQLHAGTGGQLGSASFDIFNTLPNGLLTPDSGFHMAITRTGWSVTAYVNKILAYNTTTQTVQWIVPDAYAANTINWPDGSMVGNIDVASGWFTANGLGSALPTETPIYFEADLVGTSDNSATVATLMFLVGGSSGVPVTLYDGNGNQLSNPVTINLSHVASSLPAVPPIGQYACWEVFQSSISDDRSGFLHIHAE